MHDEPAAGSTLVLRLLGDEREGLLGSDHLVGGGFDGDGGALRLPEPPRHDPASSCIRRGEGAYQVHEVGGTLAVGRCRRRMAPQQILRVVAVDVDSVDEVGGEHPGGESVDPSS